MDGEPHIFWNSSLVVQLSLFAFVYLLCCCVDIYKYKDTATSDVLLYGKKASLERGHSWLVA